MLLKYKSKNSTTCNDATLSTAYWQLLTIVYIIGAGDLLVGVV